MRRAIALQPRAPGQALISLAGVALLALLLVLPGRAQGQEAPALPDEVANAVESAAAGEADVDEDEVEILRSEAVTWDNGCLGVERPDVSCLQALTPGFVVWVEAGDEVLRYHTDTSANVLLAESGIDASEVDDAPLPQGAEPRTTDNGDVDGLVSGDVPASGGVGLLIATTPASTDDLVSALGNQGCDVETIAVTEEGAFLVLVPGAPAFVNEAFPEGFEGEQPFVVRCRDAGEPPLDDDEPEFGLTSIEVTDRDGYGVITDVRVAEHEGYDRFVLEFGDEVSGPIETAAGVPNYSIRYVDGPATECGSGMTVDLEGDAILEVNLPMAYVYDPETGDPTIETLEIAADQQVILDIQEICGFEAVSTWVAGTTGEQPFRVFEESNPTRLAIDIMTEE